MSTKKQTKKTAKKSSSKKAPAKTAKKSTKGQVRGYYAGTIIKPTAEVLKSGNPCREGSKRAKAAQLILDAGRKGISYEDYRAKGGNRFDLNDGVVRGYFEVIEK